MLQARVWRIVGTGDLFMQTHYIKMMRMRMILRKMIWQMVGTLMLMLFVITNITISQGLGQEVLIWDRNTITQPLVSDLIS
jgi:hypothetical protein